MLTSRKALSVLKLQALLDSRNLLGGAAFFPVLFSSIHLLKSLTSSVLTLPAEQMVAILTKLD